MAEFEKRLADDEGIRHLEAAVGDLPLDKGFGDALYALGEILDRL